MKSWKTKKGTSEHKKHRRRQHRVARNKPPGGSSPGALVVPEGSPPPSIRVIRYTAEQAEEREIRDARELHTFCTFGGRLWVDVQGLGDRATLEWIGANFDLHPLVLADILNVPQRAKAEEYDGVTFTIARRLRWKGEEGDLIDERQVSLVMAERHVLSFQDRADDVFDPVRKRLLEGIGRIRGQGTDYLAYALLDAVVDDYLPIMDRFAERLEAIEERVIDDPTPSLLDELAHLRGDLIGMRRDIRPQREALYALQRGDAGPVSEDVRVHLRDVHDHCVQVAELVDVYREIAAGLQNLYLTALANRTNEVMKFLTVVSTIFIPLTFLVGVWGMNFEHMPELHWKWAYPAVWAAMIALAVALVLYFRRKGWLGRK
jgi:magnesium transporter